jgi:hypothetical protein
MNLRAGEHLLRNSGSIQWTLSKRKQVLLAKKESKCLQMKTELGGVRF